MVAPHAEDRFSDPDWYFGKQSTDITRRYGKQIPSHSYHPELKNAPSPYHVIPYHDMSDKFRHKLMWTKPSKPKEDYYHGRVVTEISSPTKFPELATETPLMPWPESSRTIGDLRFSRYEYLHPLGKTRPGPMDDFVPVLRDKRTGEVIGTPSPPPSRKESRRRMLGLLPDGCHSPGSPCRSRSPSPHGVDDEDEEDYESNARAAAAGADDDDTPKPFEVYHPAATQGFGSAEPPAAPAERPYTAPAAIAPGRRESASSQKPRRKKSYISAFGSKTLHMQPVGGRPQRDHADEMEDREYGGGAGAGADYEPQTPASYQQAEGGSRVRYSLGSSSQRAQPVGGRASIINMQELEQARLSSPHSEYSDAATSDRSHHVNNGRKYPPQHPSFSQAPSNRPRDDEAFGPHKHRPSRDDRSAPSSSGSRGSRKPSVAPEYNPSLPPEGERGIRAHKRSGDSKPQ